LIVFGFFNGDLIEDCKDRGDIGVIEDELRKPELFVLFKNKIMD
jgi:hypothetical protein